MVKSFSTFHHHQHRAWDSCLKTREWIAEGVLGESHRHVHRVEVYRSELEAVTSDSEFQICKYLGAEQVLRGGCTNLLFFPRPTEVLVTSRDRTLDL